MLSKKLQQIFKGKETTRIVETVQLTHAATGTDIFFCKFPQVLNLTLEDNTVKTFTPANFRAKLPDYSESANLDFSIAFASVSFKYIKLIEQILASNDNTLELRYRFYTEDCFDYPQMEKPIFITIKSIDLEERNLTLGGKLLDSISTPIPSVEYSTYLFPSMKYLND